MNLKKIFGLVLVGLMVSFLVGSLIRHGEREKKDSKEISGPFEHGYQVWISSDKDEPVYFIYTEKISFDPQTGTLKCENGALDSGYPYLLIMFDNIIDINLKCRRANIRIVERTPDQILKEAFFQYSPQIDEYVIVRFKGIVDKKGLKTKDLFR